MCPVVVRWAGVIVLSYDGQQVILVRKKTAPGDVAKAKRAFSFPKGGLEADELPFQAALRELYEEAGVVESSLTWLEEKEAFIDEHVDRNGDHVVVRYFLAAADAARLEPTCSGDVDDDLEWARWVTIDEAMAVLRPVRREMLTQALAVFAGARKGGTVAVAAMAALHRDSESALER